MQNCNDRTWKNGLEHGAQITEAGHECVVFDRSGQSGEELARENGIAAADLVESAGIVLVRSDPRDVLRVIALSRITYKKMVQTLVWATAYNMIAIPAAAGAFVHWGITLSMSIGALAMNLSTVIVA